MMTDGNWEEGRRVGEIFLMQGQPAVMGGFVFKWGGGDKIWLFDYLTGCCQVQSIISAKPHNFHLIIN